MTWPSSKAVRPRSAAFTNEILRATASPSTRNVPDDANAQIPRTRSGSQAFGPMPFGAPTFETKAFGPIATATIDPSTSLDGCISPQASPSCTCIALELLQLNSGPVPVVRPQGQPIARMNHTAFGVFVPFTKFTTSQAAPGRQRRRSSRPVPLPLPLLLPPSGKEHLPIDGHGSGKALRFIRSFICLSICGKIGEKRAPQWICTNRRVHGWKVQGAQLLPQAALSSEISPKCLGCLFTMANFKNIEASQCPQPQLRRQWQVSVQLKVSVECPCDRSSRRGDQGREGAPSHRLL